MSRRASHFARLFAIAPAGAVPMRAVLSPFDATPFRLPAVALDAPRRSTASPAGMSTATPARPAVERLSAPPTATDGPRPADVAKVSAAPVTAKAKALPPVAATVEPAAPPDRADATRIPLGTPSPPQRPDFVDPEPDPGSLPSPATRPSQIMPDSGKPAEARPQSPGPAATLSSLDLPRAEARRPMEAPPAATRRPPGPAPEEPTPVARRAQTPAARGESARSSIEIGQIEIILTQPPALQRRDPVRRAPPKSLTGPGRFFGLRQG